MKSKIVLLLSVLSTLSLPLAAGRSPTPTTPPPAKSEQADQDAIAREGDMRDQSLENRENAAGERGNTGREENLQNRQSNSEDRDRLS